MDKNNRVRYASVQEVPVITWAQQPTIYDTAEQAKYAAAKLFCIANGVVVKRHLGGGWVCRYWR